MFVSVEMMDPTIAELERQFHDFNETCNIAVGDANTMHLREAKIKNERISFTLL